jgi:hypothetical protein
MELLLKREEKPGTFGTRYNLFAKLELDSQELTHVKKTRPERVWVMEDDPDKVKSRWRLCLIPGAIAASIISLLIGYITSPYILVLWLPIAAILWFPVTKIIYNQVRPYVTLADLITGRTLHCKSLDDLYLKENHIKDNVQKHMGSLKDMDSLGNVQRIPLNPE